MLLELEGGASPAIPPTRSLHDPPARPLIVVPQFPLCSPAPLLSFAYASGMIGTASSAFRLGEVTSVLRVILGAESAARSIPPDEVPVRIRIGAILGLRHLAVREAPGWNRTGHRRSVATS